MQSTEGANLKETSHMAKEIASQPKLWKDTYESILGQNDLAAFLSEIYKINNIQIILSGAGTSSFIGEILQQSFHRNTGVPTKAIPTTDLVTHPRDLFRKSIPTLLISFARSGDSPESLATFELAEKMHDIIYHLIITCNPEGKLAKAALNRKNAFSFLLPEGTNDLALAMTSSFTSMTLAGLLISDIKNIDKNAENVKKLIESGKVILDKYAAELTGISDLDFKRIVFLGSGALKGTAKESHLKVVELTDGQVICHSDSFLGFRHGPRAVIDDTTLLVYLFSSDRYVSSYEVDLVRSINQTETFIFSMGIGQRMAHFGNLNLDAIIDTCPGNDYIPDDFFSICSIIPAQLLGFYKSLAIGLTPDSPSKNGGIHRIVQGVTIYPY